MAAERGCGKRKKGGIYAETGLSPDGKPIEHFLIDPPNVFNKAELGVADVGTAMVKARIRCPFRCDSGCGYCNFEGTKLVWHLFNIVGQSHYPNVADWIEEVRNLGMSQS